MAIVGGGDDEDLNNPTNNAAGGGGGGYAGEGSGQGATTQPGGSPTPTSSGNYSNLSSYLQANQGAGGTTGKAAENVVDQAGNASNAANSALAINGAKEPQGAVVDQGVLGAIKGGVGSGVGGKTIATGQGGGVASAYKGPNDAIGVTGYGDAAKAMDTLGGDLKNSDGSMDHTSALLKQAYQQPSYSQGENSLDSFLVGGSRNDAGNTATQQATADWKGQGQAYQGVLDKINGGIQSAKDQTGQVQNVYDTAKAGANAQTAQNNAQWTKTDNEAKAAAAAAQAVKLQAQQKAAKEKAAQEAAAQASQAQAAAEAQATAEARAEAEARVAAGKAVDTSAGKVTDPRQSLPNISNPENPQINIPGLPSQPLIPKVNISVPKKAPRLPHLAFGGEIPNHQPYAGLLEKLKKKGK